MPDMKFNTDLAARRIDRIQQVLRRSDCTVQELADSIYLVKRWAYAYIKHLHEAGKVHIAEYRRTVRRSGMTYITPVYRWGEGQDASKPSSLTASERSKKYRYDPLLGEARREKDRARKRLARLNKKNSMAFDLLHKEAA